MEFWHIAFGGIIVCALIVCYLIATAGPAP
jgi:hypothetical protein